MVLVKIKIFRKIALYLLFVDPVLKMYIVNAISECITKVSTINRDFRKSAIISSVLNLGNFLVYDFWSPPEPPSPPINFVHGYDKKFLNLT